MSDNNFIDIENIRNNITIYIYTSPYVINIAEYVSKNLENYNIKNYVIASLISDEHFELINQDNNCFIFLLAFQSFYNSPIKNKLLRMRKNKYILYQLEQINNIDKYKKNINNELEIFMKNALYVLDYNMSNYNNLNNEINKMFVGVPIIKNESILPIKDIDILFYGNVNDYRKNILKSLSKVYNIKILEKSFGNELRDNIIRSKLILNIHYYKNALLELCRIHEAIPYKCKIISELSTDDSKLCQEYEDFCVFVDFTNTEDVINKINQELENFDSINFDINFDKNFTLYNSNFDKFVKKIKYYNLFSKDLLNIKNSVFNYELSLIDSDNNITNITQKLIKKDDNFIEKNTNISFKNQKHSSLYLDILKKVNKNATEDNNKNLVIQKKIIDNISHLHCYNLSHFDEIYGDYLKNIIKYFKPIITYCIISKEKHGYTKIDNNYILLKIENRGMDIGGKLCVVDYLVKNNIEYKYILFLHSKSSFVRRQKYFSFANDKNLEETLIKMSKNYDGVFPNLLIDGDWKTKKWYINKAYTEDLLEYLNCDLNSKKFIEGNCMLLSYRIIKKIFEDNLFLYELLNKKDSFDLNWFSWYYKNTDSSIINSYEKFINKNLFGNDLHHNYKDNIGDKSYINLAKLDNLDGYKLADGMIEHGFERIYLNVIDSFPDGKYHIINYSNNNI